MAKQIWKQMVSEECAHFALLMVLFVCHIKQDSLHCVVRVIIRSEFSTTTRLLIHVGGSFVAPACT